MGITVRSVIVVVIAMAVAANTAAAGVLAVDGNALAGFKGTKNFDVTVLSFVLVSEIDYAVYAPGQFETSFGLGSDPSLGAHFVYAYQVFNDPGNTTATREITELSVGFADLVDLLNDDELPANIGFLPNVFGNFGVDPVSSSFFGAAPGGSAVFSFIGGEIPLLDQSEILLYTSPFPPEFDAGTVKGLIATSPDMINHILPSPNAVPEPGTLTLGILGMMLVMGCRTLRRRR